MRIGLIADTHNLLRPEVLAALQGVDHRIHAGDIGGPRRVKLPIGVGLLHIEDRQVRAELITLQI